MKEEKSKEYQEGADAFNKTLDLYGYENPYGNVPSSQLPYEEWEKEDRKRHDWFLGYRNASNQYFDEKYKIIELQKKIRELIFSHGLQIEYTDEYNTPYMVTPEGFSISIAEDEHE